MPQAQQPDKASQSFIKTAIEGNNAEIEVGKLAQQRGQSDAVKQYGAMLVKDHSEANTKAQQVARQLNVKPPTGTSLGQKATYAKLKVLSALASTNRSPTPWSPTIKATSKIIRSRRRRPIPQQLRQGYLADAAEASPGSAAAQRTAKSKAIVALISRRQVEAAGHRPDASSLADVRLHFLPGRIGLCR